MEYDFKTGDVVVIKPEWRDAGEGRETYIVREWNGDRGFIQPINCTMAIIPTLTVYGYMIETEAK